MRWHDLRREFLWTEMGRSSLAMPAVADEELKANAAFVVMLDPDGSVIAQEQTTVGGRLANRFRQEWRILSCSFW